MDKKFVVLGGGTAGWLTALFLNKYFPKSKITLIESKKIGIIGVGEATTPNVVHFLNSLGINIIDFIKKTGGSIKNGISFENWNGDNTKYFHGFSGKNEMSAFSIKNLFSNNCEDFYLKNLINKKLNFCEYDYVTNLSYKNKINLFNTNFALHFDTFETNVFFKNLSIERGIHYVEGICKEIKTDEKNFINEIILDNNIKIKTDFIFDCSGFAREIISKHYKEKWHSYKSYLAMKKAIIFGKKRKMNKKINPYTKAIAMKYGWVFEIPLQNRLGRGYIFDSNYTNEDKAIEEICEMYKEKIEVQRTIDFDAGCVENVWVNNCIAVGLSASFLEPLESTSLYLTCGQLEILKHFISDIINFNKSSVNLYNKIIKNNTDETLNFIRLHYMTKRKDTEFWKNYNNDYKLPDSLEEKLEYIREGTLKNFNTDTIKTPLSFQLSSYLQVCNGLKLFEKSINIKGYEHITPTIKENKEKIKEMVKNSNLNYDFLSNLNS